MPLSEPTCRKVYRTRLQVIPVTFPNKIAVIDSPVGGRFVLFPFFDRGLQQTSEADRSLFNAKLFRINKFHFSLGSSPVKHSPGGLNRANREDTTKQFGLYYPQWLKARTAPPMKFWGIEYVVYRVRLLHESNNTVQHPKGYGLRYKELVSEDSSQ